MTRVGTVAAAVASAVVVNLLVYGIGRAVGGDFTFTRAGADTTVDPVTVAGFSAVPLGLGLLLVALLVHRVPRIAGTAMVVAPVLAVLTILVMTVPVDLDTVSTITLATCHLTLVPISLIAIRRIAGEPAHAERRQTT